MVFNIHITGTVMDVRTPFIIYSSLMNVCPHLRSRLKSIISTLDIRTHSPVISFKNFCNDSSYDFVLSSWRFDVKSDPLYQCGFRTSRVKDNNIISDGISHFSYQTHFPPTSCTQICWSYILPRNWLWAISRQLLPEFAPLSWCATFPVIRCSIREDSLSL
jgi:hypothetical protein